MDNLINPIDQLVAPDKYKELLISLSGFIYSKCKDYSVAEDMTQLAILKALQHKDELKTPQFARTWLFSIAMNELKMYQRSQRKLNERTVSFEAEVVPIGDMLTPICLSKTLADSGADPEEHFLLEEEENEPYRKLRIIYERLDDKQRLLLQAFTKSLPAKAKLTIVAECLHTSYTCARSRMQVLKKRIRKEFPIWEKEWTIKEKRRKRIARSRNFCNQ